MQTLVLSEAPVPVNAEEAAAEAEGAEAEAVWPVALWEAVWEVGQ
jgi:hypothetical protein